MAFHLDWHETQCGRGARFYEEAGGVSSLDQLRAVIAALEAVPEASARPEFVADLRARLSALSDAVRRGQVKGQVLEANSKNCTCDPRHIDAGGYDRGCATHDPKLKDNVRPEA